MVECFHVRDVLTGLFWTVPDVTSLVHTMFCTACTYMSNYVINFGRYPNVLSSPSPKRTQEH